MSRIHIGDERDSRVQSMTDQLVCTTQGTNSEHMH
jgi:hypothetical protein